MTESSRDGKLPLPLAVCRGGDGFYRIYAPFLPISISEFARLREEKVGATFGQMAQCTGHYIITRSWYDCGLSQVIISQKEKHFNRANPDPFENSQTNHKIITVQEGPRGGRVYIYIFGKA